jgi:putative oxidoreductase
MLKTVLSPFAEKAYALLRIVTGLLFFFHGLQKVFGVQWIYPQQRPEFPSQGWIGGLIELVAGLAMALGLFTRCAAFIASGTMAVAYWQFHVYLNQSPASLRFNPVTNKGELAAVYCFVFLYVACKGAGSWSLDAKREKTATGD